MKKKASVVLLCIVFISFMARGIPDSILGSAWPVLRGDLKLADSALGIITFINAGAVALTSFFGARVFGKFSTEKTVAASTLLMAVSLFGFTKISGFWGMCLWAVPLGIAAGAVEEEINNYVSLHYKAIHMNFLHCFYGIGVICSPYLMSMALSRSGWQSGYIYSAIIQIVITVLLIASFPQWKKNVVTSELTEIKEEEKPLSFAGIFRMSSVRNMWIILILTNAIEYVCSVWGCTYLVESGFFSESKAAAMITLFFLGMAAGRFLSGFLSRLIYTWKRIFICFVITFAGIITIILPLPGWFSVAGLFLIGLGNGPLYPNLILLTPYNFGREFSKSIMGTQIAAAFTGVMITPLAFGFVKQSLGRNTFFIFMLVSFILMTIFTALFVKKIKNTGRYTTEV